MRVEQLGDGVPEIAVVGCIHGDEPCGRDGIEAVLADPPKLNRPVKFIVVNEEALAAGERYLETDLNRTFPGDADSDVHEVRLAAALTEELRGCTVLSLHSTQSYGGVFALVDELTPTIEEICSKLSVDAVVRTEGANEGRLFWSVPSVIEVECGYQGSPEAAENAERVIREFLVATGAAEGDSPVRDEPVPVFQLGRPIPKTAAEKYEVFANNFEALDAGDPIAAADGEEIFADEPFHPVLLSAEGYEDVFGYTAVRLGDLE